jgi:hypothetical protein
MRTEQSILDALRGVWANSSPGVSGDDYILLEAIRRGFAGFSKAGLPTLIIPLANLAGPAAGRKASGFELIAHASTHYVFKGNSTSGPAAALVCTDPDLRHAFAILALDVVARSEETQDWNAIVAIVEEWQSLLASYSGSISIESETGLWGELWFIAASTDVDEAMASWRGPDGDSTDFFVGQRAAEVKTSRSQRHHHVSQSQLVAPAGVHPSWLLSLWVKIDPGGFCVGDLVENILSRATDQGDALRRMTRAGYAPGHHERFATNFVLLTEPEWYSSSVVPRVREVDPGVSRLRYVVDLDESKREPSDVADCLWKHFQGHEYRSTIHETC